MFFFRQELTSVPVDVAADILDERNSEGEVTVRHVFTIHHLRKHFGLSIEIESHSAFQVVHASERQLRELVGKIEIIARFAHLERIVACCRRKNLGVMASVGTFGNLATLSEFTMPSPDGYQILLRDLPDRDRVAARVHAKRYGFLEGGLSLTTTVTAAAFGMIMLNTLPKREYVTTTTNVLGERLAIGPNNNGIEIKPVRPVSHIPEAIGFARRRV